MFVYQRTPKRYNALIPHILYYDQGGEESENGSASMDISSEEESYLEILRKAIKLPEGITDPAWLRLKQEAKSIFESYPNLCPNCFPTTHYVDEVKRPLYVSTGAENVGFTPVLLSTSKGIFSGEPISPSLSASANISSAIPAGGRRIFRAIRKR